MRNIGLMSPEMLKTLGELMEVSDLYAFSTYKEEKSIPYGDEQIGSQQVESILGNFVTEQVGHHVLMTSGGRIHYVAMKVCMDRHHSLWAIVPIHKNDLPEVTPQFMVVRSMELGSIWICMLNSMGRSGSVGSLKPWEIKSLLSQVV